jgi:hypothetical protein
MKFMNSLGFFFIVAKMEINPLEDEEKVASIPKKI